MSCFSFFGCFNKKQTETVPIGGEQSALTLTFTAQGKLFTVQAAYPENSCALTELSEELFNGLKKSAKENQSSPLQFTSFLENKISDSAANTMMCFIAAYFKKNGEKLNLNKDECDKLAEQHTRGNKVVSELRKERLKKIGLYESTHSETQNSILTPVISP